MPAPRLSLQHGLTPIRHMPFGHFPLTFKADVEGTPYSSLDNGEGRPIDLSANPSSLNFDYFPNPNSFSSLFI